MKRADTAFMAAMFGFLIAGADIFEEGPWWLYFVGAALMIPGVLLTMRAIRADSAEERAADAVRTRLIERDPAPFHRHESRRGA